MVARLISLVVKPDALAAFISASQVALAHALREMGVVRFDMLQQTDNPTHFTVLEIYADAEAREAHLRSSHFLSWRQEVMPLLAEPLQSLPVNLVPPLPYELPAP